MLARSLPLQKRKLELSIYRPRRTKRNVEASYYSRREQHLVREGHSQVIPRDVLALISVAAFIIIAAILFFGGFLTSLTGDKVDSPAQIERQAAGR
jgi:hypothetical protein